MSEFWSSGSRWSDNAVLTPRNRQVEPALVRRELGRAAIIVAIFLVAVSGIAVALTASRPNAPAQSEADVSIKPTPERAM